MDKYKIKVTAQAAKGENDVFTYDALSSEVN